MAWQACHEGPADFRENDCGPQELSNHVFVHLAPRLVRPVACRHRAEGFGPCRPARSTVCLPRLHIVPRLGHNVGKMQVQKQMVESNLQTRN